MRLDDIGFFWQDADALGQRGRYARPMPEIPETAWTTPTELPRLWEAPAISFDLETFDPELIKHGPGWARKSGHIIGFSIGTPDGFRAYYPLRHETLPEQNLDPARVIPWLHDVMQTPRIPKLGANLLYDIGWLRAEGIRAEGELIDIQFAEALLFENRKVNLEALGQRYLGMGKESPLLYEWLADWFGGTPGPAQRRHLHRAPASLVGPYAESDVDLPLRIFPHQYSELQREGLLDLFRMECKLIYLLTEMRQAGVSVNLDRAEQLHDRLQKDIDRGLEAIHREVGFEVNVNAADSLKKLWDHLGLKYSETSTGRPSFTKELLATERHPMAKRVIDVRKNMKMQSTFVKGYILDSHADGKVYCQLHPLRGTGGGTRSGRFASSTPNLQNVPSRDEELAPLVRGMFIPDPGHAMWRRYDYSQIEYRFLAHFATGPGADEVRAHYARNPDTDYHVLTQELVKTMTDIILKRKPAKTINFGLIYGMGIPALNRALGLTRAEGKGLFAAYHRAMPFVKTTMQAAVDTAATDGVIRTILGRKSRFDMWESSDWQPGVDKLVLPYDKALRTWPHIKRAGTHKALNRMLQGSAADMIKVAMVRAWDMGLFDVIGFPRLTVHDELDFSDPGAPAEAWAELRRVMCECLPLRVPVLVDDESGPDWGHCS